MGCGRGWHYNQALNALVFFFREGLGQELGDLGSFEYARRPRRLPVVLSRDQVARVLAAMRDPHRLMAELLYGSGLRLMECVRSPLDQQQWPIANRK